MLPSRVKQERIEILLSGFWHYNVQRIAPSVVDSCSVFAK